MEPRFNIIVAGLLAIPLLGLIFLLRTYKSLDLAAVNVATQPGRNVAHPTPRRIVAGKARAANRAETNPISLAPDNDPSQHLNQLLNFSEQDPETACESLYRQAESAGENPDAKANWTDMLRAEVVKWSQTEPNQAVAWAQSLPAGTVRMEAMAQLSYELRTEAAARLKLDPIAATAWARALPQGAVSERATTLLAHSLAKQDAAAAVNFTNSLPEGKARSLAANAVASGWAVRQPAKAAEWVEKMPEAAGRESAVEGLMRTWAVVGDFEEAAQWLGTLPQSSSRDAGIQAFSFGLFERDPESAFQWSFSISDPSRRERHAVDIAVRWMEIDALAAKASILQSKLPPEIKNQLLAQSPTVSR